MTSTPRVPLLYIECDVPDGQTLAEWRRLRDEREPRRRRRRRHPLRALRRSR